MKYYARRIYKRVKINHFGRLGFVPFYEMFKTNNEKFVEQMNFRKHCRFEETDDKQLIKLLMHCSKTEYVLTYTAEGLGK